MRQGKSFGNRLNFWRVRPWGKHQSEHNNRAYGIQIYADTQAFEDAMERVALTLSNTGFRLPNANITGLHIE